MNNPYTENLADFGLREIRLLNDILSAWLSTGLPEPFDNTGVKPALNKNSGYVFLVNDDYQVAMLNGGRLELFHSLPYSGYEGFLSDLITEYCPGALDEDDVQYIRDAAEMANLKLEGDWAV